MAAIPHPTDAASIRRAIRMGYIMDHATRLKRLKFRSWHRGTKEADLMIGGFFDTHGGTWTPEQLDWFEALLEEQDVDIMGWAIGSLPCPPAWEGPMMQAMRSLSYVPVAQR